MTEFISTLATFVPFIFILWLANLADQRREQGRSGTSLAALAYGLLLLLLTTLLFGGLGIAATGSLLQNQPPGELSISEELVRSLPNIGLALALPAALAMVFLQPSVRRLCAHFMPLNPDSTVHTVSLSYTMLIVMNLLLTLAVGLRNLAAMLQSEGSTAGADSGVMLLWSQAIAFVLLSFVGVGWLSRRSLGQALERLAISLPSPRQALAGLGIGVIMAGLVLVVLAVGEQVGVTINEDVEKLSELLLGSLTQSIPGILTLGLAAGISEEALYRGALQPRLGLPVTSLLFALSHGQYGFSLATVIVLVVGIVLGLLRQRTNTTTAMIGHAAYNIGIALLSLMNGF